jgi:hypothetical protein
MLFAHSAFLDLKIFLSVPEHLKSDLRTGEQNNLLEFFSLHS